MYSKQLILAARILSMIFTPFYLSLVGLIALFTFSYLSIAPWGYKLRVLGMVYLFTILLPTLLIRFYRKWDAKKNVWCPTSSLSSVTPCVTPLWR